METSTQKTVGGKGTEFLTYIQQLCECVDTPHSLALSMLLEAGEVEDIQTAIRLPFSPSVYLETDTRKFADDYMLTKLCSKMPPVVETDLSGPAIEAFLAAEDSCRTTNLKVIHDQLDSLLQEVGCSVRALRRAINKILGRAPSLASCGEAGGWGPGSNLDLKRSEATPEAKCGSVTVTYKLCEALAKAGVAGGHNLRIPAWLAGPYKLVPGNMIATVRKNAKTDRTIAIEPAINSWFQKGVGAFMRKRLKRFGIDLNDQSINQKAALLAQRLLLATLDLSAASDSIALLVVELLFPDDWFQLIAVTRSERGTFGQRGDVLNGSPEWFEYQKVSSMGNGFTFELESVLFTAICLACGVPTYDINVYGDDIIVPRQYSAKVVEVLQVLGFSLNQEKSFTDGLFFESCGVHVFQGCDVTPFYMKELLNGPENYMHMANELRLYATRLGALGYSVRRYKSVYSRLVRRIPATLKVRGPAGGGICLFSNVDEIRKGSKHGRIRYQYLRVETQFAKSRYLFDDDRCDDQGLPIDEFRNEKHKWSNLRRYGLGETPYLLQFRLFQLSSHPIDSWGDDLPCICKGNTIARPERRTWRKRELEKFSQADRKLVGRYALTATTGYVFPGLCSELTRWD